MRKYAARAKRRLASRAGFTLMELICTVLIMALVGVAVATTCYVAPKVYVRSTFASESRDLEDTVRVALGDILRQANNRTRSEWPADFPESYKTLTHFSSATYGITDGSLLISSDAENAVDDAAGEGRLYFFKDVTNCKSLVPVISGGMYTNLTVRNLTLSFSDGVFSGGYTIVCTADASLTRDVTFSFKSLYLA